MAPSPRARRRPPRITPILAEGPAPASRDTLTVPASRAPASGRARLPPSRRRRHTRARQSTGATATPAYARSPVPAFPPDTAHGEPLRHRRTATPAHPRSPVHRRYGNAGVRALACSRFSAGHGPERVSAPSPLQRRRHERARPFQMSRRPRVPRCGSSSRRQRRRPLDRRPPSERSRPPLYRSSSAHHGMPALAVPASRAARAPAGRVAAPASARHACPASAVASRLRP
jgi:hypothetical protein